MTEDLQESLNPILLHIFTCFLFHLAGCMFIEFTEGINLGVTASKLEDRIRIQNNLEKCRSDLKENETQQGEVAQGNTHRPEQLAA